MATLTTHLSSLSTPTPYADAVAHPFLLAAAAAAALPKSRLALYLAQDRIYAAEAYPRFVAQLIAKIPLEDTGASSLSTRTLTILVGCLTNIVREVAFFDTTARKYNLPLDPASWRERKATRDYTAEMARIGAMASLEDGLVFLWAMEKVYLDAWSTVYSSFPQSRSTYDLTANAIRDLSYSWSDANPDFVSFVQEIGQLVDAYFAPVVQGEPLAGRPASEALARAEAIWARVVELEAQFWPNEGDEDTFRLGK